MTLSGRYHQTCVQSCYVVTNVGISVMCSLRLHFVTHGMLMTLFMYGVVSSDTLCFGDK